jgi:multiple sugar transport system permease protein
MPNSLSRSAQRTIARILVLIALGIGAVYAAFPALWMLSSSLKPNVEIFAYPPRLVTAQSSLNAYVEVLTNPEQLRFFVNSYVVSGMVTLCTLIVGILAGYAFSRYAFRGKGPLNMLIISVQAVPPITLLIPYFSLIVALRIYNTYLALILTYMVFTLPFAIIMMTGYFNTLPRELDEAVMIDGGSRLLALWRVLVPISLPGIVATGIYTFMQAWNEFLFALTLTKTNDMRTVPVGIQLLMGQHSYEWNQMMAMSVMGSLPVLILFLFFQRYFIAGMTAGSVKG